MTKPALVASKGREARGGYSSSAARPRMATNPARWQTPAKPAERGAEGDPDAMRIESVQPRVLDRLFARGERHQNVAVELALLLGRGHAGRVEILDLGRHPHRILAGVESANPV